jgi:hypothetical protein
LLSEFLLSCLQRRHGLRHLVLLAGELILIAIFCHLAKAAKEPLTTAANSPDAPHIATLYRAGMTNVVLHCLFIQQNQRV